MKFTQIIAEHLRQAYFGKNWTWSNMQDQLSDVSWEEAITKIHDVNTIATLVFHINYYLEMQNRVFEGGPLVGTDALSFDHPPVKNKADWEALISKAFANAEKWVALVGELSDEKLNTVFVEEKYGMYYRNLLGNIEHIHYHLGQIVVIKKIIRAGS